MSAAPSNDDSHHGARFTGHEYDGIREYDNPMPRWWTAMFWASFFFCLGYAFWYSLTGNGLGMLEEYEADVQEARAKAAGLALAEPVTEDSLAKLALDASMMAGAAQVYAQRCAACHADQGQGLIGPNLTDAHWLHGDGSFAAIYGVVSEGVPAKGMPAWNKQLTPDELRQVSAFIGSLRGKNLPGKAAEGALISPGAPPAAAPSASAPPPAASPPPAAPAGSEGSP